MMTIPEMTQMTLMTQMTHFLKKDVICYWFQRARTITRRLTEAWPADASLDLKHIGGPEPMNGAEWLMGYGGHAAFHRRQIDALIAQLPQRVAT
jgi:hypothetical protein